MEISGADPLGLRDAIRTELRVREVQVDVTANTAHMLLGKILAFGAPPPGVLPSLNLSIGGDLAEAASNLFAMLRTLDESHAMIAVQTIPDAGLGEAINDRLRRGTLLSRESGV